uniref:Sfr2 n=1 Tax=Arundo donax TaxID=35708 RepID=A0A0A9GA96_ARUDO
MIHLYRSSAEKLTELLNSSAGSLGITLVQSIPMRKTLIPVSLASFNSVSGSDQNLSFSCRQGTLCQAATLCLQLSLPPGSPPSANISNPLSIASMATLRGFLFSLSSAFSSPLDLEAN